MPMDMGTCLRRLCIAALALAAWPAAAQARVVAVAGGSGATFVDVSSRKPVGNVSVGGGGTGVATAPDGSRVYVAGTALAVFDPTTRATLGTVALPAASTIAVSTDGARVYAAHKGGITVVNTMAPAAGPWPAINLPGSPQAIAVSSDGTRAVVTQTKGRAVIVDLVGFRVLKRLKVTRPAGVAFAPRSSRAWVVSAGTSKKTGPPRRRRHRRASPRRCGHARPRPRRRRRPLERRHHAIVGAAPRSTVRGRLLAGRGPSSRGRTGAGPASPRPRRTARGSTSPTAARHRLGPQRLPFKRLAVQRLGSDKRPAASRCSPASRSWAPTAPTCSTARAAWTASTARRRRLAHRRPRRRRAARRRRQRPAQRRHRDDVLDGGDGDDRLFG